MCKDRLILYMAFLSLFMVFNCVANKILIGNYNYKGQNCENCTWETDANMLTCECLNKKITVELVPTNPVGSARFGSNSPFSSDGNNLAVGGPFGNDRKGIVQIYKKNDSGNWDWNNPVELVGELKEETVKNKEETVKNFAEAVKCGIGYGLVYGGAFIIITLYALLYSQNRL